MSSLRVMSMAGQFLIDFKYYIRNFGQVTTEESEQKKLEGVTQHHWKPLKASVGEGPLGGPESDDYCRTQAY
jgi:hypothetical protein